MSDKCIRAGYSRVVAQRPSGKLVPAGDPYQSALHKHYLARHPLRHNNIFAAALLEVGRYEEAVQEYQRTLTRCDVAIAFGRRALGTWPGGIPAVWQQFEESRCGVPELVLA